VIETLLHAAKRQGIDVPRPRTPAAAFALVRDLPYRRPSQRSVEAVIQQSTTAR